MIAKGVPTKMELALELSEILVDFVDVNKPAGELRDMTNDQLCAWLEGLGYFWFSDLHAWDRL